MKNKQISVQKCGIKIFQIAVFVFAFYLIQPTANAQVALGKQNRISSVFSGKCLMAPDGVNGEQIIQKECQEENQPFFFQFAGGENFQIKIKGAEKCLDVKGGGTGNGTPVILWDCHSGKNQLWTAKPLGEGYQIRSVSSGKCLDVRGPSILDGTPIQIWECGTATGKQMIYKITDIDIINEGSTSSTSNTGGGGGLALQPISGIADTTSTIIDTVSGDGAFAGGIVGYLGIASKFLGASVGLIDLILEVTKQDAPDFDEKTLTKLDKLMTKMDGLEASQKQQFDELKTFLNGKDAYRNLFKGNNVIDSQYSIWMGNKKVKSKTPSQTVVPEYKSADDIINEVSAIGNLCSGESGDTPIYDAVADANKKSYYVLPKFHLLVSSKFTKAGALGAYQRGSNNYLQYLKGNIAAAKNLTSNGVENQIVEIRRNEIQLGSKFATEQLRDSYIKTAKIQFDKEMAPHRSKCENALKAAVTKYSAPSAVKENAKSIVEAEFFKSGTIAADKLPLLLTDSNPDLYTQGRGFGYQQKLDGSFDISLAGGRFTAAIGKRLEALFPGYGFVVVAYSQYDGMPTIRSNATNRCSGATPMPFQGYDAILKSDKEPLLWKNILVEGPERICSGRADQYNFNLIVSGFKRETLPGDTKARLDVQREVVTRPQTIFYNSVANARKDSEEYGKTIVAAASNNLKPGVVSVFVALPTFANGRRTDPVYYLYPSKFSDMVSYPSTVGNLFYVISPNPF